MPVILSIIIISNRTGLWATKCLQRCITRAASRPARFRPGLRYAKANNCCRKPYEKPPRAWEQKFPCNYNELSVRCQFRVIVIIDSLLVGIIGCKTAMLTWVSGIWLKEWTLFFKDADKKGWELHHNVRLFMKHCLKRLNTHMLKRFVHLLERFSPIFQWIRFAERWRLLPKQARSLPSRVPAILNGLTPILADTVILGASSAAVCLIFVVIGSIIFPWTKSLLLNTESLKKLSISRVYAIYA